MFDTAVMGHGTKLSMLDTWSCGPQNFAALSPITHNWYFLAAKASPDNACLILGVVGHKLSSYFHR